MLIRTQDKIAIVNLDNIADIYTDINQNKAIQKKYETEIKYHAGETLNNRYLGTYSSEKKALKVLDMIQKEYEAANEYIYQANFVKNVVFEMPTDEEVDA